MSSIESITSAAVPDPIRPWYLSPWAYPLTMPLLLMAIILYTAVCVAIFAIIIGTFLGAFYGLTLLLIGRAPYVRLGEKQISRDGGESWPIEGLGLRPPVVPRRNAQRKGALIFLACWSLFPAFITPFCLESKNLWGEEAWPHYPNAFRTAWKAWIVLWIAVTAAGLGMGLAAQVYQILHHRMPPIGMVSKEQSKVSVAGDSQSRLKMLPIGIACAIASLSLLTGWNILCYAGRYGIFTGHGGISEFFYTYGYAICLLLIPLEYFFWMTGTILGGMGGLALAGGLAFHISRYYRTPRAQRDPTFVRDADLNWIEWGLIAFSMICVGSASAQAFFFRLTCLNLKVKLANATEMLFLPGNEGHTLSWGILTNSTWAYNVTTEPYRPLLPPSRSYDYQPLIIESACEIMPIFRWCHSVKYAVIAIVVYLVAVVIAEKRSRGATKETKHVKIELVA